MACMILEELGYRVIQNNNTADDVHSRCEYAYERRAMAVLASRNYDAPTVQIGLTLGDNPMILVTSATGQVGSRLVRQLVQRGENVRGQVVRESSRDAIASLGAEPFVARLDDPKAMRQSMQGVSRIYHIAPSLATNEHATGRVVLQAAIDSGVQHFVLHGAVCPYLAHLPFHQAKEALQLDLFHSSMPYTVLMGTNYMQNVSWTWPTIVERGEWVLPYSPDKRMTWLDLEDAAEAAANILTEDGHEYATYEICGADSFLSRSEIAAMMTKAIGRPIRATKIDVEDYVQQAKTMPFFSRFADEQIDQIRAMFKEVDAYGVPAGNSKTLSMLLRRPAGTYAQFLERLAAGLTAGADASRGTTTYGLPV